MSGNRNAVIEVLAEWLTDALVAEFGAGACSRDIGSGLDKIPAEQTPALWLWERYSELDDEAADNDWPLRNVGISIVGVVKRSASNATLGTIQELLNTLEEMLDGLLAVRTLGGITVLIVPDGRSEHGLTNDQGLVGALEYPIRITFSRF